MVDVMLLERMHGVVLVVFLAFCLATAGEAERLLLDDHHADHQLFNTGT